MIFIRKNWETFCRALRDRNVVAIAAKDVVPELKTYVVLKHDVETNVRRAYEMAKIERKHGHSGVYYVQAYLLNKVDNVKLLSEMVDWGFEISYHHDVMDSNRGDLEKAVVEFERHRLAFEAAGFQIRTVCQHGNPVVDRVGYNSNRDFFRASSVCARYPLISDIMVNFKDKIPTDYLYFSDAGGKFKLIFDPINNDVVPSDDKNVSYDNLSMLLNELSDNKGNFVSVHPHRWLKSTFEYATKTTVTNIVVKTAKIMAKFPLFKRIMSRYYYLAKKI